MKNKQSMDIPFFFYKPYDMGRKMFIETINEQKFVSKSVILDDETQHAIILVPMPNIDTKDEYYETKIADYQARCHRLIANYFIHKYKISSHEYIDNISEIEYLISYKKMYIDRKAQPFATNQKSQDLLFNAVISNAFDNPYIKGHRHRSISRIMLNTYLNNELFEEDIQRFLQTFCHDLGSNDLIKLSTYLEINKQQILNPLFFKYNGNNQIKKQIK